MSLLKDGKVFVSCPKVGGLNYGMIDGPETKAAGLTCGPIRLQVGYEGPKGFGFLHIQAYADRVKQIKGLGFTSVAEFCYAIASNYSVVGKARDGRIRVIWKRTYDDLELVLEWKEAGHWNIVTAVPTRVARKYELIYEVVRTGESEPTPSDAERSRFATLSLPKKVSSGDNGS